ncbi:site-2 protease family protein [Phormidesmis priestleyi ULC007]|uniref:Site-2 protease family protein n=1 Tax=Phormidesmis priestleyi ULC007 TaxID=1920490 RepID=A0A2T1DFG4_9CYAN|nr:site-2 protease family protein [Phormidesmis priestleyi]PSB19181.1 site-2 protease family protein [Phormidesmis priestleyi ULC007]PZO50049.1 MAG: site-2 protease family protein [Phormidesmis priestleyi]
MITAITVLVALGILGWGYYRAKPFGKLGILAWLQSVVLMAPWLFFFGLTTLGIYLNLVSVLLLFVASTGLYIVIGRRLRAVAQEESQRATVTKIKGDAFDSQPEPPSSEIAQLPELDSAEKPELLPIPAEDLKAIQGIFGIDTFFATETIPYQEGAIFKGNLRGEIEPTFARLSASLKERLDDRYRLFLVEGQESRPVVVVLPSTNDPKPATLAQKILAGVLLIATIATCLETAGFLLEFDFYNSLERFREVLPIALGILTVLGVHELGHWLLARRHKVRLSFPYFIPTWQIGSFGAITRFESLLPNRSALFDIAFAGPAAGGIVSLTMLITGLLLSHEGSLFKLPTQFFEGSILVGTVARVILGTALQQTSVAVHPLTILGWVGLILTAINLMPAGQLDGGRIVQAIYGRKTAGRTTAATIVVLAIASLVNPLALYWAIVILVLQRNLERPSLNELSEPDDTRAALGLLALFLMITILLPLTPSLAGRLGIGG